MNVAENGKASAAFKNEDLDISNTKYALVKTVNKMHMKRLNTRR